jgi:hypothetical protein
MKRNIFIVLSAVGSTAVLAQNSITSGELSGQSKLNPITTAVPFLMISPDSRAGAMGDVGAATDPDVNSIHWNGSKLAFAEKKFGAGFTVTPWLKRLVPDINMYYLSGYGKLNDRQTVGASLRYFTLGDIQLTDATGTNIGTFKPNEFALDLAFSQKLSRNLALGVATRFVNSGISRVYFQGSSGNAASTFAVDLSTFYKSPSFKLGDKEAVVQAGAAITNLGAKIKYSNDENFIPTNLRLGTGLKTKLDEFNTFGLYLDFNKLLVPTPPIYKYKRDANGNPTKEYEIDPSTGKRAIESGKDPDVDPISGVFRSFGDAPGGFKEEMKEVNICTGAEYNYNNIFAVRGGYFYEAVSKGSRQFFTVGMGLRLKVITIDGSFLVPTKLQNPLQGTFRFSISFYFDGIGDKDGDAAPATN